MLKRLLPKTKRERSLTGRSLNRPRRNSKATVTIVARLVIGLLIVMLQERTKTKAKAKIKQTSWKKMEDADDLCAMISECNLVGNPKEWFLDSRETIHICSAKEVLLTCTLLSTIKINSWETQQ